MSDEREQRNQVFAAAPTAGVDARIPTQSAVDKFKADFGIDIPTETVPLPSNGKVYPPASPLHNQETVDILPMTAREEDILTSRALMKKGTILSELIKSCLVNKAIDPLDMLIGDRTAIMVAIRITGYGADYDTEVECNECQNKSPKPFNLGELPIRRLALTPVADGLNLFEFTLPLTKKVIRFKFLTGRDEEQITATADRQKKLNLQSDATVTTNLLYCIQAIDGIEDRAKIASFVRMMPARDSLALRSYIRDNEPGIIMRQEVTCPSCGCTEVISMPIGITFFWPGSK